MFHDPTTHHTIEDERLSLKEAFEALMFASNPTQTEEPFWWKWTNEGKDVLLSFIAEREALADRRGVEKAVKYLMKVSEPGNPKGDTNRSGFYLTATDFGMAMLLTPDNKHKI